MPVLLGSSSADVAGSAPSFPPCLSTLATFSVVWLGDQVSERYLVLEQRE